MRTFRKVLVLLGVFVTAVILLGCAISAKNAKSDESAKIEITILATSDVHNNYMDYDYFVDKPTDQTGLVRLASKIDEYRKTDKNVLLFDDGDNIQGNPFGEYLFKNQESFQPERSPITRLMNTMKYDAIALGNHEFNFGLDYLNKIIGGAEFPVICSNVLKADTDEPYFQPYALLERTMTDTQGKKQKVKIGVIGLVPPQIMNWDGANLRGRVTTVDGFEAAEEYAALLKEKLGADIVVVLAHSGLADFPRKGGEENFAWYITNIPHVDVVISGHAHMQFPGSGFRRIAGVNLDNGTINGVPVIMPGSFADHLGAINITVENVGGRWQRVEGTGKIIPVYNRETQTSMPAVSSLVALLKDAHEAVLKYIRSPVGKDESGAKAGGHLTAPLTSFYALIHDDFSTQIINEAQTHYIKKALAGTEHEKLPVLSAAAPFKSGGRQGPSYYTNVPAGPLAIKNMADIYVYPNTVVALKVTGQDVREWLERSAGQFHQIRGNVADAQQLVDSGFPTYNFDVIDGLTYEIDVSQSARYDNEGALVNPDARRIVNMRFAGNPLRDDMEFVIVTNNYRAYGGGNFPGVTPEKIVYESPDESRQVILQYIEEKQEIVPSADNNWKLRLPKTSGAILFTTSPLAKENLISGLAFDSLDENGFGVYKVDVNELY
ncbi:MAG: bifunctional 2',3'-cyclic-nucleotide 2'-phosphodiesterase/3'-nucleotidase [Spirochaetaceae bacterium]|jgi:2',3'-cyclic-nucleotide 2'-phosphodiesterase/3'-nucleotidase|nr:bifunctional 2',3'-cyclic-nucleotide 2'-phosphodiesterase/3'-nucleotidase [Spirochaetaceae bacterium]